MKKLNKKSPTHLRKVAQLCTRDWLNKNKVFFEIFAAIFLAGASIFVSLKVYQVQSRQVDLMRLEHLPILNFDIDLIFDYVERNYNRDILTILNEGSPLSEFRFTDGIFFKIEYGEMGKESRTAMVPLIEYYDTTFLTNNPRGKLATLLSVGITEGNNWKAAQTIRKFAEFARERNAFGFADIVRYIRVWYKDIWGELHDEVYIVDTHRVHKVPEKEGKKIFKDYESQINQNLFLKFSEVSPESLYGKLSMILQKSKE